MRDHKGELFNQTGLCLTHSQDFGKLYDYFAPRLYRHALIRTNSPEEAEDITAKTFLKTWEYVKGRQKIKNIRAFLYKTADNLIIDWYRAKVPVLALSQTRLGEEDIDVVDPQNVEESLIEKFDVSLIKKALAFLKPHEQAILVMRFIDDLTIDEIAEALGKSKGAVAVQSHRALTRLTQICRDLYGTLS
ncbi:MAG: RNA polymerase sigma factor [Parcubacteria group bacterium]|nr:RNA polymerase sigma factor [Parcubacteria group bacterium]